jgi:hypothetical protein
MKNTLKTLTLVSIFLFAASLKSGQQGDAPHYKNQGYFTASIDGKLFDTRSYNKYTADVENKSDYSKYEQSADLTFFGGTYYDQNGNQFGESLQFKYVFSESTLGDASGQKIVFQFNNQKFISIPGQTKIHISKAQFNADRTSMTVSADFDGKMLQWVAPGQPQPIVHVKGKMENINVTIPVSAPTASL